MVSVLQQPDSERLSPSPPDVDKREGSGRQIAVELRRLRAKNRQLLTENGQLRKSNSQLLDQIDDLRELVEELDPSGHGRYGWWLYGSATA